MEGTTFQPMDSNEMENIRVTLEAMTRTLEKLSMEVGAIRGEITTISRRLEQVESQRNSHPSTPRHVSSSGHDRSSSTTVTPETWPQLPNPALAPLNAASQTTHNPLKRDSNRPTHSQTPQVFQEELGRPIPLLNPNPPFRAPLSQRPPPPQNPIHPNQVPNIQNHPVHFEEYGREDYKRYGAFDDAYMREEEMRWGCVDPRRYQGYGERENRHQELAF
ncbi:hypothetical protein P3S67_032452 [Capsicum chacoense]